MQKNSLRVNRLIRTRYGPYTLEDMKIGEVREVEMTKEIVTLSYLSKRKRLQEMEQRKMMRLGENEDIVLIGGDAKKLDASGEGEGQSLGRVIQENVRRGTDSILDQVRMLK